MVLDDVLRYAGLLVELAASFDADLLGDGDLDVVDRLARPERLEEAVREPEDQEVLNGLFPEVVIDAEDLRFVERLRDGVVEHARARQIVTEGLLDDGARPR